MIVWNFANWATAVLMVAISYIEIDNILEGLNPNEFEHDIEPECNCSVCDCVAVVPTVHDVCPACMLHL